MALVMPYFQHDRFSVSQHAGWEIERWRERDGRKERERGGREGEGTTGRGRGRKIISHLRHLQFRSTMCLKALERR